MQPPFLISYCLPVMNRLPNLKGTLPFTIAAANMSPPVEIVIADYGSTDGLKDYIDSIPKEDLAPGNFITYFRYDGNPKFHLSHARNIANLQSHGDYLAQAGVEMKVTDTWFKNVREVIGDGTAKFLTRMRNKRGVYHPTYCPQIAIIERSEFIKAGGFDEQFYLYCYEDRDLAARLIRRGVKPTFVRLYFSEYETDITATDEKKYKNYGAKLPYRIAAKKMRHILGENMKNNVLVANEGQEWGTTKPFIQQPYAEQ